VEQDGRYAYTFVEKWRFLIQSVRRAIFKAKKQVFSCILKQFDLPLQPKMNKRKEKVRII